MSVVIRAVLVVYLLAWAYSVGRTWLVLGLPQEAVKSFALGVVIVAALFFLDRRLGDFRRR